MGKKKKTIRSKQNPMIKQNDFEEIDIGIYKCKTTAIIWGSEIDVHITCWDIYTEYGYDDQALIQCANQSNLCLDWIQKNKEYIQEIILKNNMCQRWSVKKEGFDDRLCPKNILIEIYVEDETPQELSASIEIYTNPFFPGHRHCTEVVIQAKENGTYKAEVTEDVQRLLLEIRAALKIKNMKACEWAKNNGIFYAFNDEGDMLAAIKQQFCLSIDGKLISETDDEGMRRKELSKDKQERNTLYFIWAYWTEEYSDRMRKGRPMPFGFIVNKLTCEKGVFTITSSSGHKAILGTFPVIYEALTMIEMLYHTRGVSEENINTCYYRFLVEDHQNYIRQNKEENHIQK